jgi:hypothetical protein
MPDDKKQKPQLSAICPGDLGLKAGYWTRKDEDQIRFRPILGWVTVTNFHDQGIATEPFQPVVLNDHGLPVPARFIEPYLGTFASALTAAQAREEIERWPKPQKAGAPPQQSGPRT